MTFVTAYKPDITDPKLIKARKALSQMGGVANSRAWAKRKGGPALAWIGKEKARDAAIIKDRLAGASYDALAATYGVTKQRILVICIKAGLKGLRPRGRPKGSGQRKTGVG
jgi:hypothetical protein